MVISLGLITTALLAVFRLQAQNVDLQTEARFVTLANQLARDRISRIQSGMTLQEGTLEGDFGEDFPGFYFSEEIRKTVDFDHLYKVTVNIRNDSPGDLRGFTVEVYLFSGGQGS